MFRKKIIIFFLISIFSCFLRAGWKTLKYTSAGSGIDLVDEARLSECFACTEWQSFAGLVQEETLSSDLFGDSSKTEFYCFSLELRDEYFSQVNNTGCDPNFFILFKTKIEDVLDLPLYGVFCPSKQHFEKSTSWGSLLLKNTGYWYRQECADSGHNNLHCAYQAGPDILIFREHKEEGRTSKNFFQIKVSPLIAGRMNNKKIPNEHGLPFYEVFTSDCGKKKSAGLSPNHLSIPVKFKSLRGGEEKCCYISIESNRYLIQMAPVVVTDNDQGLSDIMQESSFDSLLAGIRVKNGVGLALINFSELSARWLGVCACGRLMEAILQDMQGAFLALFREKHYCFFTVDAAGRIHQRTVKIDRMEPKSAKRRGGTKRPHGREQIKNSIKKVKTDNPVEECSKEYMLSERFKDQLPEKHQHLREWLTGAGIKRVSVDKIENPDVIFATEIKKYIAQYNLNAVKKIHEIVENSEQASIEKCLSVSFDGNDDPFDQTCLQWLDSLFYYFSNIPEDKLVDENDRYARFSDKEPFILYHRLRFIFDYFEMLSWFFERHRIIKSNKTPLKAFAEDRECIISVEEEVSVCKGGQEEIQRTDSEGEGGCGGEDMKGVNQVMVGIIQKDSEGKNCTENVLSMPESVCVSGKRSRSGTPVNYDRQGNIPYRVTEEEMIKAIREFDKCY